MTDRFHKAFGYLPGACNGPADHHRNCPVFQSLPDLLPEFLLHAAEHAKVMPESQGDGIHDRYGKTPVYLRLLREGNTYSAYASGDDAVWNLIGQHTADMKPSLVGIVAGGDTSGAGHLGR